MLRITRVLTFAEYVSMQEEAVAKGWYRNDRRMFTPGMAWPQPWYFDPRAEFAAFVASDPGKGRYRREPMILTPPTNPDQKGGEVGNFLSPHYWRDWATMRAPIAVVCPNGCEWEMDRWSSNGTGWTVTGELPNITCAPSIICGNYHGYLRDGEFTDPL